MLLMSILAKAQLFNEKCLPKITNLGKHLASETNHSTLLTSSSQIHACLSQYHVYLDFNLCQRFINCVYLTKND
jgi:hypothetical protein